MGARTRILALIPGRKYLGELVCLEDLFLGLDPDRWELRFATLAAPRGADNVMFDGRRLPTAWWEHGTDAERGEAFDERPDALVFCNWQRDFTYLSGSIWELVELIAALRVPVALTDANNQARFEVPCQADVFRRVDRLFTQCMFNRELEPAAGVETAVYRPNDLPTIRRLAPADPTRLAGIGAGRSARPRICVAVSTWADHVSRVPGPSVFQVVMERLHARFGDAVEVLVMGRHAGDLAHVPGAPIEVPTDLGFSEASEVLASVDLLISFNVNSQAAARARAFGGRVLFITSKAEDIWRYGYRDFTYYAPGSDPSRGWAILVAHELSRFEELVARLLELDRVPVAPEIPTGAAQLEAWLA